MKSFKGFTDSESFTQLPDTFFHQLLNQIDDAAELKVTLYFLWRVEHMDSPSRLLRESDLEAKVLGLPADEIRAGVEKALQRGSLLKVEKDAEVYLLLNSPRGRAIAQAIERGERNPESAIAPFERPNIFRLYEENIGPLTPLIANWLEDAEKTYSEELVAEAIKEAAINNVRKIPYIESVLKNRKENGRGKKQDRRDNKESRQRDVENKIKRFISK